MSDSTQQSPGSLWKGKNLFLLLAVVIVGFATKRAFLSWPDTFYFDEIYHAFTATQYLHGAADSYNPRAATVETPYAWDHPPLARLIMAATMALAGEDAVDWRLSSVIFGTGVAGLTAILAAQLFNSTAIGLLAATLLTLESSIFVLSRIGMGDIHFIFFTLLSLTCYCRWRRAPRTYLPLTGCALAAGAAIAAKWSALYLLIIFAIDLAPAYLRKAERASMPPLLITALVFFTIPAAVYLLSYTQYFLLGYSWEQFIRLQRHMWFYHVRTWQTHPYQSGPIEWILNLRPVHMWAAAGLEGKEAHIYNLGNSVILLCGLFAVIHALLFEKQWSWEKRFALICYFAMWLPWLFSPRLLFSYHYTPAVPFLCIILARALCMPGSAEGKVICRPWLTMVVTGGALLWFVMFFPHATGLAMPKQLVQSVYFFLPTWK